LVVVSTVATRGEWQCEIRTGGVRRLAVANGPNIFQMLLVILIYLINSRISMPRGIYSTCIAREAYSINQSSQSDQSNLFVTQKTANNSERK